MGSIMLCLQFCHKDIEDAFALAQLIADLEPTFNSQAEILLFNSHFLGDPENNPRIMAVANHLRTKFSKVHTLKCMRRGEDYPGGSNDMWFDLLQQVWALKRDSKTAADCVLTFEADCLPTRRDWIALLEKEWAQSGALIVGALSGTGADTHINGNMLIAISLSQRMTGLIGCPATAPWDMYYREQILQVAKPTTLIRNDYRKPTASYNDVFGDPNVALIHGIRDSSGRDLIRKHIINGEPAPAVAWKPSEMELKTLVHVEPSPLAPPVVVEGGTFHAVSPDMTFPPAHSHTVISEVKEVFPIPSAEEAPPVATPEEPKAVPKPKKKAKAAAAA